MAKRTQRGKTKFTDSWKNTYSWVTPADDPYSAKCTLCQAVFCVSSMGIQALKSHAEGKKHKSIWNTKQTSMSECFAENIPPAVPAVPDDQGKRSSADQANPKISTANDKKPTLDSYLIKDQVTFNEARWCIQTVVSHRSLRHAESDIQLLKKMTPDAAIQDMKLSRTKIAYVSNYGLGSHFQRQLVNKITKRQHFVVAFDESLNKFSQSQQMDVLVRFWDEEINEVKSRYLTSVFLTQSKAVDLLEALKSALQPLDQDKLVQISMDGPNVNWKVFRLLQEEMQTDQDNPRMLLNIGSCGIHVVHGAFRTGIKGTRWDLSSILRALYYLFKDSPSRRGAFTRVTGCTVFPLKFCETRWVENLAVVQRAAEVLGPVKKYIEEVGGDPKTRPACKSFTTVQGAVNDHLLAAKLAFFATLAGDVEPFMREFQTDAPVAPMLYDDLKAVVETLMARIVKKDVLDSTDLKKIDVDDKKNLLQTKDFEVGFGTRKALGKCTNVSAKDVLLFHADCGKAVQLTIKKILERSPLKYDLTKFLRCLNPEIIRSVGADKLMKRALDEFVRANRVGPALAETIARKYAALLKSDKFKDAARDFTRDTRLNAFWTKVTDSKAEFSTLRSFVELALILSHGNASVERGFSVNKDCIVENQRNQSLIAQRQIYDYVTSLGGAAAVPFSKPLVHAVRNAYQKYQDAMEEQRKGKEEELKAKEQQKEEKKALRMLELRKAELDEHRAELLAEISEKKKKINTKK